MASLPTFFFCVFIFFLLVSSFGAGQNIPRACSTPETSGFPFCDPSLSFDERVNNLISLLELDEKTPLLEARESPLGNISRLGIPEYDWGANCIHGVQSRCGTKCPTSFPTPGALGASFNRSLWQAMGAVIGIELRSLWLQNVGEAHTENLPHIGLDCWSPNINIIRDPRWGRNMETPSEDPLILGLYGTLYTVGLQNGSDPRYLQGVSTLKHYDANSLEGNWGPYNNITRHNVNAVISLYDLASSYLPAFKATVVEGNAMGVMCSYNAVNGQPSCVNSFLFEQLREKWGFQGYVTSDSGAIDDVYQQHHYTANWTQTVAEAILAGCDIESANWPPNQPWATGGLYVDYVPDAIAEGLMTEGDLDLALYHTLMLRFRLGLFDPIDDQPYWHVPPEAVNTPQSIALSLLSSQESIVLLKNQDKLLPLPKGKTIAVIGPNANVTETLLGNYIGQICPSSISDFSCVETIFGAVSAANNAAGGQTTYTEGCGVSSTDTSGFAQALSNAQAADYVVLVLGIDTTIEAEGLDRHSISLPGVQDELAQQLIATGKPVVVVLINGGVLGIDDLSVSAPAIVEAWYPGIYGAEALATVLFGDYNPGGKLPVTMYYSNITSEFDMLNFSMNAGPGRTYRYFTGEALYPFGYGLSYTTFSLSSTETDAAIIAQGISNEAGSQEQGLGASSATFNITVTNTGSVTGDEVVMGFFASAGAVPGSEPASAIVRQLFDFTRVTVAPGQSTTVSFSVGYETLNLYDADGNTVSYPGEYNIIFTNGVDQTVSFPFMLTGTRRLVEKF